MNEKIYFDALLTDKFKEEGLYLIFPDGNCVSITESSINNYFEKIWHDSSVFPPHIKKAVDLDFCIHCPGKDLGEEFCAAIRPILPFLEKVDKYMSYDKVTAVLKTENPAIISITHTDLQDALRYVSLLSLMQYCETNRKFWSYYFGVSPISNQEQALSQIYLNIFWLKNGDENKTREAIDEYSKEIRISDECLLRRLRLICTNDAFLNAYANTQMSTEFLSMDADNILAMAFKMHNKKLAETI